MDDKTLALLGDRAAQDRITERGELLPCHCGCEKQLMNVVRSTNIFGEKGWKSIIQCNLCFSTSTRFSKTKKLAEKEGRLAWNTRVPILTPEQIKRLEQMENEL